MPDDFVHPSLFDAPTPAGRARRRDPVTSKQAAREMTGDIDRAALDLFACGFVGTDDELVHLLPHLHAPSVKTARSRLAHRDRLYVEPTGELRLSDRNAPMIVWRITTKGREVWERQQHPTERATQQQT